MSDLTDDDIVCWLREELAPPLVDALRELQRHRAEESAARVTMATVGVAEQGPIDQLVCTLASQYLELRAAQAASKERVREVVKAAALDALSSDTGGEAWDDADFANLIASQVEESLAAPAVLSAEEREILGRMRNEAASGMLCWKGWPREGVLARMVALLDRLLGAKP